MTGPGVTIVMLLIFLSPCRFSALLVLFLLCDSIFLPLTFKEFTVLNSFPNNFLKKARR